MQKSRPYHIYVPIMLLVMAVALLSRSVAGLPSFVVQYAGDCLWAVFVFLLFAVIFQGLRTWKVAVLTLIFSYLIEVSQLFHPDWLQQIRAIKVCALVLGHHFLWSDVVAYTVGVAGVAWVDKKLFKTFIVTN